MKYTLSRTAEASGSTHSKALDYALDMVEAMADSGQVAVPVKPSPTMLAAGVKAGGVTVVTVWKIYHAMIAAA